MSDLSKISINGTTYSIKDEEARRLLEDAVSASELNDAVESALTAAKDRGELNGADGNGIESIKCTSTDGLTDTYTITFTDGTTTTFAVVNGAQGEKGPQGEQGIQGEKGDQGEHGIQGEQGIQGIPGEKGDKGDKGDQGDQGEQGIQGETGNGIAKIEKTSTDGLVDTYTITFTDGSETTFTVNNGEKGDQGEQGKQGEKGNPGDNGAKGEPGNGIVSIELTSTNDLDNTYTITFTDGTTTTFIVTNGRNGEQGIQGIQGQTGANGESAYQIWLDEGNSGSKTDFLNSLKADVEVPTKVSELENDSGYIKTIEDGSVTTSKTDFIYEYSEVLYEEPRIEEQAQENLADYSIISDANHTGGYYASSTSKWNKNSGFYSTNLIETHEGNLYLYGDDIVNVFTNTGIHITWWGENASDTENVTSGATGVGAVSVGWASPLKIGQTVDQLEITSGTDSHGVECVIIKFGHYISITYGNNKYVRFALPSTLKSSSLEIYYDEKYQTVEIPGGAYTKTTYRLKNKLNAQDVDGAIDISDIDGLGGQWAGKKWIALGTSITSTNEGRYVDPLVDMSGLVVSNYGVSGSSMGGHILHRAQYYASELATADLVTIEGAVNDYASSRPLGEVGDTVPYKYSFTSPVWNNGGDENGTFAGACYQVFKTVLENAPNAVVVCLTDTVGQNIESTGAHYNREARNSIGKSQHDYNKMLKAVAEYMGVIVVDTATLSGITQEHPEYYADHLHHSELGGKQFAQTAWASIKNIPLKITE